MTELQELNLIDKVIVGGDFNARVGCLNQIDKNMVPGCNVKGERHILNEVVNYRESRKLVAGTALFYSTAVLREICLPDGQAFVQMVKVPLIYYGSWNRLFLMLMA